MSDYTYTNDPGEQPGLTLETLERAVAELEAMLPELLYRTHEYAPLLNDKGETAMMSLPEYDPDDYSLVPRRTGRTIVIVHPDNLPVLRQKARGMYRLVKWQPIAAPESGQA